MPINSSRRSAGDSAAACDLEGVISNGVTWVEDLNITEDGTAVAGTPTAWTWTITLKEDYDSSPIFSISTSDYIDVTQGTDSTVLSVGVPKSLLTNLKGDYLMDIKSIDGSDLSIDPEGRSRHWAHGPITVRNEP